MSRGLNKQLLFDDETDYLRYLQLLNDIKKEYGIKVYAYCLMSNHQQVYQLFQTLCPYKPFYII